MHYTYILRCNDDTLYTGYTNRLQYRIQMHQAGKGAKYTRGRGPFSLVYVDSFESKSEALKREIEIKKLSRKQKESLIEEFNGNLDEYNDNTCKGEES
jgi:putative endonuclease